MEAFQRLQVESGVWTPVKIPLHSNVRWSSAHKMLDRALLLRQVAYFLHYNDLIAEYILSKAINMFISTADDIYGPMTTIRREGRIEKHIRWEAFKLSEADWARVKEARDILQVRSIVNSIRTLTFF